MVRVAELVQLAGICVLVAGCFMWSLLAGVFAAGVALLLVGLAADPRVGR